MVDNLLDNQLKERYWSMSTDIISLETRSGRQKREERWEKGKGGRRVRE